MFAFVVPGRLVQQTVQDPAAPERFLAQVDNAQELNHITVFLTGQAPFPEGYGATVHLEIPGKGFQLIGGLSNEKPSAIFRLRGTFLPASASTTFTATNSTTTSTTTATLGILCEPLAAVAAHLAALPSASNSNSTSSTALVPTSNGGPGANANPVQLAQLVGKNLFNAVAGFVKPLPEAQQSALSGAGAGGGWIEFGEIERWYRNFERKLKMAGNIGFLLQE
ncbi:Opi10p [Sporobolomyces koalae]|uniref:Opi10p n=1 Tax=Sporobolomyces koalae TaxID=500713 RepID=UPI00317ECA2D